MPQNPLIWQPFRPSMALSPLTPAIDRNRANRPLIRVAGRYGYLLLTQSDHGIDGACSAGRHIAGNERRSKEDQTGTE